LPCKNANESVFGISTPDWITFYISFNASSSRYTNGIVFKKILLNSNKAFIHYCFYLSDKDFSFLPLNLSSLTSMTISELVIKSYCFS